MVCVQRRFQRRFPQPRHKLSNGGTRFKRRPHQPWHGSLQFARSPPRYTSRNNIAAVTTRHLLRVCVHPPLSLTRRWQSARGVGRSTLETLFSDHAVAVDLRCGKANTKTPRFFARLDPVFARDNSGPSVHFFHQGGADKISYLVSLVQEAYRK